MWQCLRRGTDVQPRRDELRLRGREGKKARRESSRERSPSSRAFCMWERWLWVTKKICSWWIARAKVALSRKQTAREVRRRLWSAVESRTPDYHPARRISALCFLLNQTSLIRDHPFTRYSLHFWVDSHLQAMQADAVHKPHTNLSCVFVCVGLFWIVPLSHLFQLSLNPLPLMQGHNLAVKALCCRTCLGIKGPTKAL